jgi:hypothetical protein
MGTVSYKNQPGIDATNGHIYGGTRHVYTVKKVLWPEEVADLISTLLVPRTAHICCGQSVLGDLRVDRYEDSADLKADCVALPLADESFETVLCDPPYNGKFQWNHDLLRELSRVARQRIIFQHWFIPADPDGYWKKWHKFRLTATYVWQPRTYFGRAQIISVFDAEGIANKVTP